LPPDLDLVRFHDRIGLQRIELAAFPRDRDEPLV
jgi:hypothetical protein